MRAIRSVIILSVLATLIVSSLGAQNKESDRPLVSDLSTCPGPRREPGVRPKVVGGWSARLEHWPGQVALRIHNPNRSEAGYLCGGSVISPHWVLTAAHCAYGLFDKDDSGRYYLEFEQFDAFNRLGFKGRAYLEVVLGTQNLTRVDERNVRSVQEVVIHEKYRDAQGGDDIALLRLSAPWPGPYARLSLDPIADPQTPPGTTAMVAGFGNLQWLAPLRRFSSEFKGSFAAGSPLLREVDLPTVPSDTCQARYPGALIGDGQICAGHEIEARDSCQGDSGGQLVSFDRNGCPYQVGVVSWGDKCAVPRNYGIYTRVSHFAEWIRSHGPKTETMLTVSRADIIDWSQADRQKQLVDAMLAGLEKTLSRADSGLDLTFRRVADDGAISDNRIRLQDRYVLEIRSNVRGRLVLIDVDAAGQVTQLFPNRFVTSSQSSMIDRQHATKVPGPGYEFDWFRAVEPVGKGKLLALVVPVTFPVSDVVASAHRLDKGLMPERAPANYLMSLTTQIAQELKERYGGVASADRWAIGVTEYEIVK